MVTPSVAPSTMQEKVVNLHLLTFMRYCLCLPSINRGLCLQVTLYSCARAVI